MAKKNKLLFSDERMSQVEDVVLRCFFPEGKEITINEIMERAEYSYERVNTALKRLEDKKIVSSKRVGKTLLYRADYNSLYLNLAFHRFMTRRLIDFANKHQIIYNALKDIEEEPLDVVILFGSYSRGGETKNSDIDLMIISEYQRKRENAIHSLKSKYGLNISPVFVKRTEFPKIKKENPGLWQDLKNYALIFKGRDLFFYWVYQHENN